MRDAFVNESRVSVLILGLCSLVAGTTSTAFSLCFLAKNCLNLFRKEVFISGQVEIDGGLRSK